MNKLKKKLFKKNFKITPILLNKNIKVYNGKIFYELKILPHMVNHKIGEFFLTKTKKK